MCILTLGNSFIFCNNLLSMLAELTSVEVVYHNGGGTCLY